MVKASGLFLINKKGEILVGHPTRHDPNFWSIPKGKIESEETPLEGAIRETFEETNINLNINDYDFIDLGKVVYKHKKKNITMFAVFESEEDNWSELDIKCNSRVPKERGGFLEMDDFKWVSIDEAKDILHDTQVSILPTLEDLIDYNISDKIWCSDCEKCTPHRKKLSAFMDGYEVCGKCYKMNPICLLTKEGDDVFMKRSTRVLWLTFNDDGTFKESHDIPDIGRSLLMSPFNFSFTWQTTPIIEIIGKDIEGLKKYVKFKTKNSVYKLTWHKI